MIVKTNQLMNAILGDYENNLEDLAIPIPESLLHELEAEEFAKVDEIITFKGAYTASEEGRKDPTGIECRLNKWHFDEIVVGKLPSIEEITRLGIAFALAIRNKLNKTGIPGSYRIIVSSNSSSADIGPTCTVRFHQIRDWNFWIRDDLDSYQREALMTIDWEIG
jgi:hypothetical protein